jgi:hypothetical protein
MNTNIYETFRLRKKNTENVWVKLKLIPLWSLKWKYKMHAWHKKSYCISFSVQTTFR